LVKIKAGWNLEYIGHIGIVLKMDRTNRHAQVMLAASKAFDGYWWSVYNLEVISEGR